MTETHFVQNNGITAIVTLDVDGKTSKETAEGNGRLDAVSNAIKNKLGCKYVIEHYSEHSLTHGSNSDAIAYVGIRLENGEMAWGAGTDSDIIKSGIKALVSACNQADMNI